MTDTKKKPYMLKGLKPLCPKCGTNLLYILLDKLVLDGDQKSSQRIKIECGECDFVEIRDQFYST